ncbi:MAG: dihydrodipicolinate synthase family protein [Phycisphaeraceae bacterium]
MNGSTLRGEEKVRGLVPVLPTPVHADESIDHAAVQRLAEYVLRYPFSAVWALASAGEDENLSDAQISDCTRTLVKHLGGRLPVIVKTSTPGVRQTIERTRALAELGIDATAIHFQHKMLGVDHMRRYFHEVADASPVPVFIYHNALRGAQMPIDLLIELSSHPRIAGVKAGGSNLSELQRLCLMCDPDFSVLTAGGGQLLAGLAMGAAGHTAIPLLAFPERAVKLAEYVAAGELDAARAQQRVILEFIGRMPKLENREVNGEVKAVLELRGVMQRHVTAPFRSATDEEMQRFQALIEELDLFDAGELARSGR